jgi:hypothetical protein
MRSSYTSFVGPPTSDSARDDRWGVVESWLLIGGMEQLHTGMKSVVVTAKEHPGTILAKRPLSVTE